MANENLNVGTNARSAGQVTYSVTSGPRQVNKVDEAMAMPQTRIKTGCRVCQLTFVCAFFASFSLSPWNQAQSSSKSFFRALRNSLEDCHHPAIPCRLNNGQDTTGGLRCRLLPHELQVHCARLQSRRTRYSSYNPRLFNPRPQTHATPRWQFKPPV